MHFLPDAAHGLSSILPVLRQLPFVPVFIKLGPVVPDDSVGMNIDRSIVRLAVADNYRPLRDTKGGGS